MKPPRSAKRLPRYTRRKPIAGGRWGYFFAPPTWARKSGCPIESEALGHHYDTTVIPAEDVLLKAFDPRRTGGRSEMAPLGPAVSIFEGFFASSKATTLMPISIARRGDWRAEEFEEAAAQAGLVVTAKRYFEE